MRQDQKQLIFWLCPGCAADAREKERREQLVKKAVSANTTPVKLSAAVKLPENGEQEEEDEDNDNDIGNGNDNDTEEGGAKVEDVGNQDKEDKPRDGRGSGSSAPGGKSETSMATGSERGGEPLRATGGSGGGGAAGGDPKPEGNRSPEGDLPTWKGLGGMGNNSLPDGTGVDGEGARGSEEQGLCSPGEGGDKEGGVAAGAVSASPGPDEGKGTVPSGVTE